MSYSILITDDEQAIRESLSLFLEGEGYNCQSAGNGREAVQKACEEHFDLVLLDMNMPRNHGLPALTKIKECSPDTIAVILTSYYDIEDAAKALSRGAAKLVLKPIDFEELLEIIQEVLRAEKKKNPPSV